MKFAGTFKFTRTFKFTSALKCSGAVFAVIAASAFVSAPAAAQNWPTKQITILVGTAPGGTYDTIARLVASHFEKRWGQPVVVESRSGNILATSIAARAAPDGYTLVMGASNNAHLFIKDLNFDPQKDVVPVSVLGIQNYLLLASRGAKVKNIADFVAQAKANPGKFNFGVVTGGPHDIETNDMQSALGIKVSHIGYKGIAPIYVALMSSEIDAALGTTTPQLKTGEIIALAIAGEKRHPEYPDVPTFRESGIRYEPQANYPLYTRAGVPREVLAKMSEEAAVVAKSPEFAARVTRVFSIDGVGLSQEASAKYLNDDVARQKRVAERVGIKPQ